MSDPVKRAIHSFDEHPLQAPPELAAEARRFAAVSERAVQLFGLQSTEPSDGTYVMTAGEGHIPSRVFSHSFLAAQALRDTGVEIQLIDNVISARGNPTGFFTVHASKRDANLASEFLINKSMISNNGMVTLSYFMMRAVSNIVEIPIKALRPGTEEHLEIAESLHSLPDAQRVDIIKRGFMTGIVIDELRNPLSDAVNSTVQDYIHERQTAFRILYSQGFKPLGLEELMGLTQRSIHEWLVDEPDLAAQFAEVKARGKAS